MKFHLPSEVAERGRFEYLCCFILLGEHLAGVGDPQDVACNN